MVNQKQTLLLRIIETGVFLSIHYLILTSLKTFIVIMLRPKETNVSLNLKYQKHLKNRLDVSSSQFS